MNEIEETAERLKRASVMIADQAAAIKKVADELRDDVDALAKRVANVEGDATRVAKTLVKESERVEGRQVVQDTRLDTLENGSGN